MRTSKVIGIIPARYGSTRFPGKLLKKIGGKTIVRRLWEQCRKSETLSDVIVATESEAIKDEALSFGGRVIMTASSHQSGTDRVAEAAEKTDADIIVNIQGDEPFISPDIIDKAVLPLVSDQSILMGTAASRLLRSNTMPSVLIRRKIWKRRSKTMLITSPKAESFYDERRGAGIEQTR